MKSLVFAVCIFAVAFAAPRLRRQSEDEVAGAVVLSLNAICTGFREIGDAYDELENGEKRSLDSVIEGLGRLCEDLEQTQIEEIDTDGDGEIDEAELDAAAETLLGVFASLCQKLGELFGEQKRSWESVFTKLAFVCMDLKATIKAELENKRAQRQKLSKDEFEELLAACEELKNADSQKRGDLADLERACKKLGKALDKAPKTDDDGNPLPKPTKPADKRQKLSKDEFEELLAACEELKNADSQKRGDLADLERACKKLGKALDKASKTDDDGNPLPKPTKPAEKRQELSKDEFEELLAACEELKNADSQKRGDLADLERACKKLGKALDKASKTDEDGNPLPKPTKPADKRQKLSKDEFEELLAACEELKSADSEKRGDLADLERVCKKLGKALDKAPKTDDNGNPLPKPTKPADKRQKLSKDEFEELLAACEELKNADSQKRGDLADLERACKKLGKALDKVPKTDADGNPLPKPTKPAEKRGKDGKPEEEMTEEEFLEIVKICEEVLEGDNEKRDEMKELVKSCRKLRQELEKLETDEDGNLLPPPADKRGKDDKPEKEKLSEDEFIALVEACEELANADSEKRDDLKDLERACRKLAKALEKLETDADGNPIPPPTKPAELERKGKGGRPPKTDEDGNPLPPPRKDDKPDEDDLIALIEACEALEEADSEKRDDLKDLERACEKLAKFLDKLETDADGNPIPPPTKPAQQDRRRAQRKEEEYDKPTGPKPSEMPEKKRGKDRRPPKTDADGNILPKPQKGDKPDEDDLIALIEACEALEEADSEKRDDLKDLERACEKLAKFLENAETDADGNILPPPTKPSKDRRMFF